MEHDNESARTTVDQNVPVEELAAEFKRCFDLNDKSGMLEAHRRLMARLSQEGTDSVSGQGQVNDSALTSNGFTSADGHTLTSPIFHQGDALETSALSLERRHNPEATAFLNAFASVQKAGESQSQLTDFEIDAKERAFKPRISQQILETPSEVIIQDNRPNPFALRQVESVNVGAIEDDTKALIAQAREQAMKAREEAMALELELAKRRAVHLSEMLAHQDEVHEVEPNPVESADNQAKDERAHEKSGKRSKKSTAKGSRDDVGVTTGDLFDAVPADVSSVAMEEDAASKEDFRPEVNLVIASENDSGEVKSPLARLNLKALDASFESKIVSRPLPVAPDSYYDILGLDRFASNQSVERTFLQRAKALLKESTRGNTPVSNDLVSLFVARDIILDPLSRDDHDFRLLSLKRSTLENQRDRSEDDRNAKKAEIAEAIIMAGLLEADEVDVAMQMHAPNKNQLFFDFLVENKMLDADQIESAILGRLLVKDGRLKANGLKRSFRAARTFAVDFIDALLVSVEITLEEILELAKSSSLETLAKKIDAKISSLKPAEKAYVYKPRPIDPSQENTETRLQKLLMFDRREDG